MNQFFGGWTASVAVNRGSPTPNWVSVSVRVSPLLTSLSRVTSIVAELTSTRDLWGLFTLSMAQPLLLSYCTYTRPMLAMTTSGCERSVRGEVIYYSRTTTPYQRYSGSKGLYDIIYIGGIYLRRLNVFIMCIFADKSEKEWILMWEVRNRSFSVFPSPSK